MILILGGRYQGKLDFARARWSLEESDIFRCDEASDAIDLAKKCLAYIDRFALNRVRAGEESADFFRAHLPELRGKIIISTDISSGVVPVDPALRAWREASGRANCLLAAEADEVWRLFCGIPQRLK